VTARRQPAQLGIHEEHKHTYLLHRKARDGLQQRGAHVVGDVIRLQVATDGVKHDLQVVQHLVKHVAVPLVGACPCHHWEWSLGLHSQTAASFAAIVIRNRNTGEEHHGECW
jgi:hypothetical protein